jgi:serralysin
MSYTEVGGPYTTYRQYDIAALMWLYGDDGLHGALGINSTTGARYITGTSGADVLTGTGVDDKLEGDGGNDMIDGGVAPIPPCSAAYAATIPSAHWRAATCR